MSRVLTLAVALLLVATLACDDPSADPPPPSPSVAPTPTPVTASPSNPAAATAEQAPDPAEAARAQAIADAVRGATSGPLEDNGLPPFTKGRPIRLAQLEADTRQVDGRAVPTVPVADEASRARLDELLAADTRFARQCRVMLATETVVSVRCTTPNAGGMGGIDHHVVHYRVGTDGDVGSFDLWEDVFHPGASELQMTKLLLHSPGASQRRGVLTRTGLSLSLPAEHENDSFDTIPWRSLAPYVRADSPIGELLAAEELPLAPVGTAMPDPPETALGIWSTPSSLMRIWKDLPEALRGAARFVDAGEIEGSALVFPPGIPRDALTEHSSEESVKAAYYVEPTGRFVMARATSDTALLESPGRRSPDDGTLPSGATVPVVAGLVELTPSGIGRGRWAFVLEPGGQLTSWVQGRDLEEIENERR
jgi:hypothetical protein